MKIPAFVVMALLVAPAGTWTITSYDMSCAAPFGSRLGGTGDECVAG